jgi:hypothetical protein
MDDLTWKTVGPTLSSSKNKGYGTRSFKGGSMGMAGSGDAGVERWREGEMKANGLMDLGFNHSIFP